MSQAARAPLACGTCHRLLDVKICKSNKNGNRGKHFVSCHKRHADGSSCRYYHWLNPQGSTSPSRSSSESPSGSSSSSPSLPLSPPLTLPAGPAPVPARRLTITLPSKKAEPRHCAKSGCKSTRLHPDCLRHMCRRHCAEAGGCHAKGHSAMSGPISTSGNRHEKVPSLRSPTSPRESSATTTGTSSATDMFADPRYASQMTAAFTKHYALEQGREELRRVADTERLANIDKAKHHVVIYAWPKVCFGVHRVFSLLIMFQ
jgi:hypothetical protein